MMKKLVVCLLVMLVCACATSRPTKFYNITSFNDSSVNISNSRKLVVGIDTVSIPGYLERPQIVTMKNANELDLAEFDRWAEPISNSLQRAIATNVSSYMKKSIVKPANVNRRGYDYIVSVEFNKLDGKFGDKIVLDAWWSITNKDNKVLASEHTVIEDSLGSNYDDLVMKQSDLVGKLSIEIAKKINNLK